MTALRNRILRIQSELATGAMSPDQVRENILTLTALYGNVNDAIRILDRDYKLVLLGCMEGKTPRNKAEIQAQTTPQYMAFKEMSDTGELVLEMIRSLKECSRSLSEELRMTPRIEQRSSFKNGYGV